MRNCRLLRRGFAHRRLRHGAISPRSVAPTRSTAIFLPQVVRERFIHVTRRSSLYHASAHDAVLCRRSG